MGKVTLDDLAASIQKQFQAQNKQFDEQFFELKQGQERLEGKFGNLEQGQKRLENQVSGIRDDLLTMKMELNNIKASISRIEKRTIQDDDAIAFELEKLKKRVNVLEKKLKLAQ